MKTKINSDDLKNLILHECKNILPRQIKWRRHLHQFPELSYEEFKTTAFIKNEIKKMGIKILPLKMKTGLLAEISGQNNNKTVALRADIDALPVTELTSLAYKSKIPGQMHACGHDVHAATLLGVALVLNKLKDKLPGNVRLIFQPAEEKPPGGARPMIENGVLKNVSTIFALHVDPTLKTGKIGLRDGITMASVTDFDLIIHGKGGHAAVPHNAVDPIVTACEIVESLQKIITREIDPIDPVVITFGKIEGGIARNVIPEKVFLNGTARTLSKTASKTVPKLIKRTALNICRARGAKLEMNIIADYPVLNNYSSANKIISESYEHLFGKGKISNTEKVMGGEDFACYLETTQGAMFRLGAMNKKIKADKPWHSPYFCVDEKAIYYGTAALVSSAIKALSK